MRFGFDLDGCIINFEPVFLHTAKKIFGIPYKYDHMVEWSLGLDDDKKEDEIVKVAVNRWMDYKPYEDAVEFVENYYKLFREPVYFITSRKEEFRTVTENWLKGNLNSKIEYELIMDKNKVEVSLEKGIKYFVEDKSETVIMLSNANILTFIPDRTWNQNLNVDNENIIRFTDWKVISTFIKERLKFKNDPRLNTIFATNL